MQDPYKHMYTQPDELGVKVEKKKERRRGYLDPYTLEEVQGLVDAFYHKYGTYPTAKHFEENFISCTYETARRHLKETPRQYLMKKFG